MAAQSLVLGGLLVFLIVTGRLENLIDAFHEALKFRQGDKPPKGDPGTTPPNNPPGDPNLPPCDPQKEICPTSGAPGIPMLKTGEWWLQ